MTDSRTTRTAGPTESPESLDAGDPRGQSSRAAGSLDRGAHVPAGLTPIERLVAWSGRLR